MGDRLSTWAKARIIATTDKGDELEFTFPGKVRVETDYEYLEGRRWDFSDDIFVKDADEITSMTLTLTAHRQTDQPHICEVRRNG